MSIERGQTQALMKDAAIFCGMQLRPIRLPCLL